MISLFAIMGLPWPAFLIIVAMLVIFLGTQNIKAAKPRRRIMALPKDPQPPTQGEAFAALDVLMFRMAETGIVPEERKRLYEEIVPKLLEPREL